MSNKLLRITINELGNKFTLNILASNPGTPLVNTYNDVVVDSVELVSYELKVIISLKRETLLYLANIIVD